MSEVFTIFLPENWKYRLCLENVIRLKCNIRFSLLWLMFVFSVLIMSIISYRISSSPYMAICMGVNSVTFVWAIFFSWENYTDYKDRKEELKFYDEILDANDINSYIKEIKKLHESLKNKDKE